MSASLIQLSPLYVKWRRNAEKCCSENRRESVTRSLKVCFWRLDIILFDIDLLLSQPRYLWERSFEKAKIISFTEIWVSPLWNSFSARKKIWYFESFHLDCAIFGRFLAKRAKFVYYWNLRNPFQRFLCSVRFHFCALHFLLRLFLTPAKTDFIFLS